MTAGKSIELLDLKLEGTCVEGDPLKLYPICKIVKPPLTIISETMSSFEFKYESDAERVDLILDNVGCLRMIINFILSLSLSQWKRNPIICIV